MYTNKQKELELLIDRFVSSLEEKEQTELINNLNGRISPVLLKKILNFLLLKGR